MSDALSVRLDGRPAGVAVRQASGDLKFFTAIREASPIENRIFGSVEEIALALREELSARRRAREQGFA